MIESGHKKDGDPYRILAYYQNIPGVYTTDFPVVPPVKFDYTGNVPRGLWQPSFGTKLALHKQQLITIIWHFNQP